MRTSKWIMLSASLAAAIAGFVMLTGCEDTPSTDIGEMGSYSSVDHDDAFSDTYSASLAITPDSWTLTSGFAETNAPGGTPIDLTGETIQFYVNGGMPPYGQWRVSQPALGTIDPVTGLYTVNGNNGVGDNLVMISDHIGRQDTAKVTIKFK